MAEEKTTTATTMFLEGCNITQFTGEDPTYSSSKWCQDIEDNAEIFSWTPHQKLIIARRTLSGTAALWLRSERVFKSYDDLKAALTKEFPDTVNVKEMHELMAARKKHSNESVYQYMLIMKELGKRARFPDYIAIQYIIDGIVDHEYNKHMLHGVTTYSDLKTKLAIYEKIKTKASEASRQRGTERNRAVYNQPGTRYSRPVQVQYVHKRCYNCGEMDHVSSECKNGLKCFRCNQFGHIRQNCKANPVHTGVSGRNADMASARREQAECDIGDRRVSSGAFGGDGWRKRSAMFGVKSEVYGALPRYGNTEENELNVRTKDASGHDTYTEPENDREKKKDLTDHFNIFHGVNKEFQVKKPEKLVLLNKFSVNSLFDTGSDCNLMARSVCSKIGSEIIDEKITMTGLGECQVCSMGKVYVEMLVDDNVYNNVVFHLVPDEVMPYDVILGQEFLSGVTMIMNAGVVTLRNDNWIGNIDSFAGSTEVDVAHVQDISIRNEVMQCVQEYQPTQEEEAPIQLKIILKDDIPIRQRPRRLSLMEQQVVEEQVDEWLRKGIIRLRMRGKDLRDYE
ncbi:uncharacterized protein LOC126378090 [Pectinophora gossypiella]|nr:uncharacterized protein LOC126378090 [Pectinophora gossypiella]